MTGKGYIFVSQQAGHVVSLGNSSCTHDGNLHEIPPVSLLLLRIEGSPRLRLQP